MKLIKPSAKYYEDYVEAIKEYKEHHVETYQFLDVNQCNIFEQMEDFRTGNNLPDNYVKATYLWLIDNDEFVGEVSIRHSLTDSLLSFGGNIGYGIRYSKWNKGLGTKMLSMTLQYAKESLGLDKVLITCNDINIGSVRIIEKNGGILENKVVNVIDGVERLTRRYWIEIL